MESDKAVFINKDRLGHGKAAKRSVERISRVKEKNEIIGDAEIIRVAFRRLERFGAVNGDDGNLAGEFFLDRGKIRQLLPAKRTPGGPGVEHHGLAVEIHKPDGLSRIIR